MIEVELREETSCRTEGVLPLEGERPLQSLLPLEILPGQGMAHTLAELALLLGLDLSRRLLPPSGLLVAGAPWLLRRIVVLFVAVHYLKF